LFLKIEFTVQNFPTKKAFGRDNVIGEFHQKLKEQIIPILNKFFPKNIKRENSPQLFEDSKLGRLCPKNKIKKKQGKLQDHLTFKHRQNLGKTLANEN